MTGTDQTIKHCNTLNEELKVSLNFHNSSKREGKKKAKKKNNLIPGRIVQVQSEEEEYSWPLDLAITQPLTHDPRGSSHQTLIVVQERT